MKAFIKKIIIFCLAFSLFFSSTGCDNSSPSQNVKPQFFTATYSAEVIDENFSGGTIKGETLQTIEKGKEGSAVEALPNYGYKFKCWSDGVAEALRQDKNIQANIDVTATFEKLETFELEYLAAEGGHLLGSTKQTVPLGKEGMYVTAVPNEGYTFTGWSDGVETATRLDKGITQDITATAYFEKGTFNLQYDASTGGKIEGNTTQSVVCGNNATEITAVPNVGYKFIKWSDNTVLTLSERMPM